ncbi:glycosyltransferase family 2 protein [Solirubrobacter sp. CPCC 204708]|nr:glycosyltransferase family 2 protein [Solirubrobacter deserti]
MNPAPPVTRITPRQAIPSRRVPDVILPVLNERDALPWVLERMPDGYLPIVVDNGSTDGSGELAASLGARVVPESTPGFGAACYAGLTAATAEIVCFMDCDASFDPRELPKVADPVAAGSVDLMLGARRPTARGAWPIHARAANTVLALELRRRTKVKLKDLGPMRAARREALLALGIRDRRFGWPLEMVLRAADAGWRIGETQVAYHPRDGESKVTGTAKGTVRAIRDMAGVLRE